MKALIMLLLVINCCLVNGIEERALVIVENKVESSAIESIKSHITFLKKMPESKLNAIAQSIYTSSKNNDIDPKIMTSIIMVESSFNQQAVSYTGDVSIVQINYKVWSKEAKRLGFELSESRLKKDSHYAIQKMGTILKYLKKTYSKKDSHWYARYHSGTYDLKMDYAFKVNQNHNGTTIAAQ